MKCEKYPFNRNHHRLLPEIIFASITWLPNVLTRSLVPLQKPIFESIFVSNITGTLTFNTNLWIGKPFDLRSFRISGEYKLSSKSL